MNINEDNNKMSADEVLKEAAEILGNLGESPAIIKEDDEFQFECQRCGECCTNREDIILNAFDIYNMASHLGITCADFIIKYTNRTLGGSSKMPIVTMKMDKDTEACPFLKFDYMHDCKFKCTVHPVKPGACRCHPIGIMSECEIDNGNVKQTNLNFIKVDQCDQSKVGEKHKVKEWMNDYLNHKEEALKAHELSIMTNSIVNWKKLFVMVGVLTISAESKGFDTDNDLIGHSYNILANIFIQKCYGDYDTSKPFFEQCNRNYEGIKERFETFARNIMPSIELLFNDSCGQSIDDLLEGAEDDERYQDDDGKLILEKLIYEVGKNQCTYTGLSVDSEGDDEFHDE